MTTVTRRAVGMDKVLGFKAVAIEETEGAQVLLFENGVILRFETTGGWLRRGGKVTYQAYDLKVTIEEEETHE